MPRRRLGFAIRIGIVLLGLGCSLSLGPFLVGGCGASKKEAPVTPAGPWGHPRTSPQNVADNLLQAIVERDSLHYEAQLADSFRFVFALNDTEDPQASWGRADELIAMGRLFRGAVNLEGYVSESIGLTWYGNNPDTTAEFPTWPRVVVTDVSAVVNARHRENGNLLEYIVQGDHGFLWFEKSGVEWRLVRWEERASWEDSVSVPEAGFTTKPVTLGQIKSLWR